MIELTLQQIASIVSGELTCSPELKVAQISTDSRFISEGELFFALNGKHFDAHNYVVQVAVSGATAAVVSLPQSVDIPQIIVADTLIALGKLGAWLKAQCQIKAVAVTGSAGKTTVKELIAAILAKSANVLATQGNFNNEIGVALTLLQLEKHYDFGVFELGANHPGEIFQTVSLVQPDVAVITNIGSAHLEGFGSIDGIAKSKGEIFSGLKAGGFAVLEAENPYLTKFRDSLVGKELILWSVENNLEATVKATEIQLAPDSSQFVLVIGNLSVAINLPMAGLHNVKNALAAASACFVLGVGIAEIAQCLNAGVVVRRRLELHKLAADLLVIDDSYNANLVSTKAAIDVLVADQNSATALVFGDMGELGKYANKHHHKVGQYARRQGVDALFTLGSLSKLSFQEFAGAGAHSNDLETLMQQLNDWLNLQEKTKRVLIKGSRSAAMERVLERLTKQGGPDVSLVY